MSRVVIAMLLAICLISSCSSEKSINMNVYLKIYPSSGGNYGYSITVRNDKLLVTKNSIDIRNERVLLTDTLDARHLELSTSQAKTLLQEYSTIHPHEYKSELDEFILDGWMFVLSVNGKEYARFNSQSILADLADANLRRAREIIKYLMELSPLELDLGSFS